MLPGRAFDPDQPAGQPVFLGMRGFDSPLLEIFFDITVGCLFGKSTDGAGTENMIGTEQYFRVFVGSGLIFPREVQVDIRCFLIPRKSKEGLKGDVKSVSEQFRTAAGTVFLRHVGTAPVTLAQIILQRQLFDRIRLPGKMLHGKF